MSVLLKIENHFGLSPSQKINWTLVEGEIVGLVGKNGCGKTTLLKQISGVLEACPKKQKNLESITTWREQERLDQFSLKERVRKIRYVPHEFWTAFPLTTLEVLNLGESTQSLSAPILKEILKDDPLLKLIDQPFPTLSTGQRQLVLAWKALLSQAELVFFDETFSMMDFEQKRRMQFCLEKRKAAGKTFVIVSHDWGWLHQVCDHLVFLDSEGLCPLKNKQLPQTYGYLKSVHS